MTLVRPVHAARLLLLLAALALGMARPAFPQSFERRVSQAFEPVFQSWSFGDGIAQDSVTVRGVSQFALPLSMRFTLGDRWAIDATTAYASANVDVARADATTSRTLSGMTDLRLRLVGPVAGERVLLALSVNVPTGRTRISGDALEALRVAASPALRLPVPSLGTGAGITLGAVYGFNAGGWALGTGLSVERRGEYQPVQAIVAGATIPTDLRPGMTIRASLGGDRLVGEHRLNTLVAVDWFTDDAVRIARGSAIPDVAGSYRLGPVVSLGATLDLASDRVRDAQLFFTDRIRLPFTGIDGATAEGSRGNIVEIGASGALGQPGRIAPFGRIALHFDTGLPVDNTIATAAMSDVQVQLGLELPTRRSMFRPSVAVGFGQLDAGDVSSTARSIRIGMSVTGR